MEVGTKIVTSGVSKCKNKQNGKKVTNYATMKKGNMNKKVISKQDNQVDNYVV
jgi:hypothetical protein